MQRVLVLAGDKSPLMPCHPARARKLLGQGKAKVYRMYPFTIILTERKEGETQKIELKLDPGSKVTGLAINAHFDKGIQCLFAANLQHRGQKIREALAARRAIRRSRRHRKTRYRKPRFSNRTRPAGWLPPSLQSRVDNDFHWARKLTRFCPISEIAVETVRFDLQKMQNPEISGIEYQQGELYGYEVREYLLEKWQRKCAYCGKGQIPLQIEHILAKSLGGTNRVSNLTLACEKCNLKKSAQPIEIFVKDKKKREKILAQAKAPLKDATCVNATRYAIGTALKTLGLPLSFWSGGRTKKNRCSQSYPKDHWIDAACVGLTGEKISILPQLIPLNIEAQGRGSRQKCRVNRFGFPRTSCKAQKMVNGFQTGDIVRANVPAGKKKGVHTGRVAVRSSGNFNIKTTLGTIQGIPYRYCRLLQQGNGYFCSFVPKAAPPSAKAGGSPPLC